jgi:hypothetical protein
MLRLDITDSQNNTSSDDLLVDSKTPGTYSEKIGVKTVTAFNCDPSKGNLAFLSNNKFFCFLFNRIL